MTNEDPKDRSKKSAFSEGIKSVVNLANGGLSNLETLTEGVRRPILTSSESIGEQSTKFSDAVSHTYARRKEFAPYIIGSSAMLGGSVVALRRGRIAGIFGASAAGAAAYGVVYDEISFDKVPDMIFGKKD